MFDIVLPQDSKPPADTFDVLIVGAGPGGMTAAIYCARGRLSTVVLERNTAGGQMALTERIENYPGFPEGISGFDLTEKMKKQAGQFGADLREITTVAAMEPAGDRRWRIVTDEETLTAKAVVLAPGVEARNLGIPGEAEFLGRGVSYCATCDGALYRGKQVAVIGGGDSAVEEGLFLTKFADAVYVIHRRDQLRANKVAQERAFANPKMHFIWDSQPRVIRGEGKVEAVEYQNLKTGVVASLPVDGVFIYVGQAPNTAFLQKIVDLDEWGYIKTDPLLRTNQPGVFACGDARTTPIKQIAWAVGEGALAGIQAEKYIDLLGEPEAAATESEATEAAAATESEATESEATEAAATESEATESAAQSPISSEASGARGTPTGGRSAAHPGSEPTA